MSNIEKICQEIERRKKVYLTKNGFPKGTFGAIKIETYEGLLAFITALPEEKPTLTVEDIKTILDISFWNNDPQKILEEYNRICDTSKVTRR